MEKLFRRRNRVMISAELHNCVWKSFKKSHFITLWIFWNFAFLGIIDSNAKDSRGWTPFTKIKELIKLKFDFFLIILKHCESLISLGFWLWWLKWGILADWRWVALQVKLPYFIGSFESVFDRRTYYRKRNLLIPFTILISSLENNPSSATMMMPLLFLCSSASQFQKGT